MRCSSFRIFDAGHVVRDTREPAGSPTPAARSGAAPAVFQSPEAGSSPDMGALQPSRSSAPAARSEHQGALRILGAGNLIKAPGRSPKPGNGQLAGPGCAEAFLNPRRQLLDQSTRRISPKPREKAARPHGRAAGLPESSPPAARSEHQGDLRSSGADSSPVLDALQAFPILDVGSTVRPPREIPEASTPTARSEHQANLRSPGAGSSPSWACCSFPDPQSRPHGQSTRRDLSISGAGV